MITVRHQKAAPTRPVHRLSCRFIVRGRMGAHRLRMRRSGRLNTIMTLLTVSTSSTIRIYPIIR